MPDSADDPIDPAVARPAAGAHPHVHPGLAKLGRKPKATTGDGDATETRTFTEADLDALRKLLADDRKRVPPERRPRGPAHAAPPPNLGAGLVVVLVVTVVALATVGALIVWVTLGGHI